MPSCPLPLPPSCSTAPKDVFKHSHLHCAYAQSRYVDHCTRELNIYYYILLAVTSTFLFLQLLVLLFVMMYLRQARQRARMERAQSVDETFLQRGALEQQVQNRTPGSSLVLPAYYWFLRFECLLCALWVLFYGVCIWLETDPSRRIVMVSSSPSSRVEPSWTPEFIVPLVLVFACNAVGTTLDTSLMIFLSHQNAGQKVWKRSVFWGITLGALSGILSILPKILLAQHEVYGMTGLARLSGFANDSLIRLVLLLIICIPIGMNSLMIYCDPEREHQRSSVSTLVGFKFTFTAIALGLALFFFITVPESNLRESGTWKDYKHAFITEEFPARVSCFAPWAIFFVTNGLVVYLVLWQDSQFWRNAGIRGSMFANKSSSLADPLLRPREYLGAIPKRRNSSRMFPRFQPSDIIDFAALYLMRKIGGGASSTVWEACLAQQPSVEYTAGGFSERIPRATKGQASEVFADIDQKQEGKKRADSGDDAKASEGDRGTGLVRVAVKQLHFIEEITADTIELACVEAELLRALGQHPNIIGWFGICVSPPHLLLVTELGRPNMVCTHMDIGRSFLGSLSLPSRLSFVAQITSAVIHLHLHGVIMRDLKCCNVLMDLHSLVPKLCDFGIAKLVNQKNLNKDDAGSQSNAFTCLSSHGGGRPEWWAWCTECCCSSNSGGERKESTIGGTVEFMAPEVVQLIWEAEKQVMRHWHRQNKAESKKYSRSGAGTPRVPTSIFFPNLSQYMDEDEDKQRTPTKEELLAAQDVYSLGVILWMVLYVQDPWLNVARPEVMMRVISGEHLDTSLVPEIVLDMEETWEDLRHLLHQCFNSDPSKRPNASSVRMLLNNMAQRLASMSQGADFANAEILEDHFFGDIDIPDVKVRGVRSMSDSRRKMTA